MRAEGESRIPLSRMRVLSAAIGIADESGIEGLTIRRLAEVLGVEAMSLYHHVVSDQRINRACRAGSR
ncbi:MULTISPECIES: hypothetical protein [unclassified Nocardia]|uniref:hypothetical protein n=1 Tax=unclassified Nocardia TaxID=2637762 RepID=UPI0034317482